MNQVKRKKGTRVAGGWGGGEVEKGKGEETCGSSITGTQILILKRPQQKTTKKQGKGSRQKLWGYAKKKKKKLETPNERWGRGKGGGVGEGLREWLNIEKKSKVVAFLIQEMFRFLTFSFVYVAHECLWNFTLEGVRREGGVVFWDKGKGAIAWEYDWKKVKSNKEPFFFLFWLQVQPKNIRVLFECFAEHLLS